MNVIKPTPPSTTAEEKRALLKKLLSEGTSQARSPRLRVDQPATSRSAAHEIPVEYYQFDQSAEYLNLRAQKQVADDLGIEYPFFKMIEPLKGATAIVNGRECVTYSSYNYIGMSGDPRVNRAVNDAVDRYGSSASASRMVAGERPIHKELERALADHLGTEDAIAFVTGYLTGVTTIGHLMKAGDLILHDSLIHNCSLVGAKLSGARMLSFPHNDVSALDDLLGEHRASHRRVLIVAEGVYSMDGDIADLPGMIELKHKYKTYLMVDEAHSIGVLGRSGRGIGEHFGVDPRSVDLWMGTLSKALGGCGGYIAGSGPLIDYLRHTAPGFVYSVGMPPPIAAASLEALAILRDEPSRLERLQAISSLFLERARARGLDTGLSRGTPIVPVMVRDSRRCGFLAQALYKRGINVQPIIFPAVEDHASRLRFFLTSLHTETQVTTTVDAVAQELGRILGRPTPGLD